MTVVPGGVCRGCLGRRIPSVGSELSSSCAEDQQETGLEEASGDSCSLGWKEDAEILLFFQIPAKM